MPGEWQIQASALAQKQLAAIKDKRVQQTLVHAISRLETDPEKMGKPLTGSLAGLYSVRAYSQRYRILYKLDDVSRQVIVLALGLRKEGDRADIYSLAQRLVRRGFLLLLTLCLIDALLS